MISNNNEEQTNEKLKEIIRLSKNKYTKTNDNVIHNKILNKLIEKFPEYNPQLIEAVTKIQWKFLHSVITMGKFQSVRLKYLGLFGVKHYKTAFSQKYHIKSEDRKEYNNLLDDNGKDTIASLDWLNGKFKEWQESEKETRDFYEYPVIQYQRNMRNKLKPKIEVARFNRVADAVEQTGFSAISIYNSCVNKAVLQYNMSFELPEKNVLNFN